MTTAAEVMTRDVAVISPSDSIRLAAQMMDELGVGSLPVCDGRRIIGIITDRDITTRATSAGHTPDATRVSEAMTEDIRYCFEDDPIEDLERTMSEVQIRRIPVVDRNKNLVGIVSLGDLATKEVRGVRNTLQEISEPSAPDRKTH